jgi:anthraniloyl-CoA monooxygenase
VVAVSADGRITPGCAGLYEPGHVEAWTDVAQAVHRPGAVLGLRLGHAGRRGSTRVRDRGADRPLPRGGWPIVAPSPIPYLARSPVPEEMVRADMDRVVEEFRAAAERAAVAGVDLLLVHMAHGYLLGSFLSPLSNVRDDEDGGDIRSRARFPLRVIEAVREAWPDDRPMGASIPAADGRPGGWDVDDAVVLARALRRRGCDVVEPLAGQTTPESRPRYGRAFLSASADRIRNEARIPVLVGGAITTTAEVNTILAGGRADLCILAR